MDEVNNPLNSQNQVLENNSTNVDAVGSPMSWKTKISLFKNSNFRQFLVLSIFLAPLPICMFGDGPSCSLISAPIILFPLILVIPLMGIYFMMSVAASVLVPINLILSIFSVFLFAVIFYSIRNYFLFKFSVPKLGKLMIVICYLGYCFVIFNMIITFLDKSLNLNKFYY